MSHFYSFVATQEACGRDVTPHIKLLNFPEPIIKTDQALVRQKCGILWPRLSRLSEEILDSKVAVSLIEPLCVCACVYVCECSIKHYHNDLNV